MKKSFVILFLLFGVNPAISADSSHFDPVPIVIQAQSPTPVVR
jgi:hypothetical protein